MAQVVICLRRLDRILERLECFWARCELDIDTMIRRSDHVYALLTSARTPEMRARLDLRLTEYATFWSRVQGPSLDWLVGWVGVLWRVGDVALVVARRSRIMYH